MPPQSDEANLARIRDNQRRSRARRKEYQTELEQRVRTFEELGVEASTEVQHAARRVAEENKKLRALLQHVGISHAGVEAFLRTGDYSAATTSSLRGGGSMASGTGSGTNAQVLDRLMVPQFPMHYTSPLVGGGSLSASASAGPSSPVGGGDSSGGAGTGTGTGTGGSDYHSREPSQPRESGGGMGGTSSNSSPAQSNKANPSRGGSSHGRHGHRSSNSKGKGASTLPQTRMPSSSSMAAATATTTADYTAGSSSDYLTSGYGLSTSFYGLDATSTEELQYSAGEPAFYDYSMSPHYLGGGGGSGMAGHVQPSVPTSYYGQAPGMLSSGSGDGTCPACMSGMGCQVHGNFFEE